MPSMLIATDELITVLLKRDNRTNACICLYDTQISKHVSMQTSGSTSEP